MPDKRVPLVTGEIYHVFNRGIADQPIFITKDNYEQAKLSLIYYQLAKPPLRLSFFKQQSLEKRYYLLNLIPTTNDKLVKIISYCLMPNHFHLLLKQTSENGISKFLSKISNSYTKYFNQYNKDRVGPILQGVFKAVHIETQEQLIHVSRYIHLNPVASNVINESELFNYKWSSLPEYLKGDSTISWSKPILENFKDFSGYKNFLLDQISYAKQLEAIKHLTLDED